MLSQEKPANTATLDSYRATLTEISAQHLGSALVNHGHNPDPKSERNAPNPNVGIRVRRIDMEKSVARGRVPVTQECADHNSRVSSVGHPERFKGLWGGQS
jgi:hypothetical protein